MRGPRSSLGLRRYFAGMRFRGVVDGGMIAEIPLFNVFRRKCATTTCMRVLVNLYWQSRIRWIRAGFVIPTPNAVWGGTLLYCGTWKWLRRVIKNILNRNRSATLTWNFYWCLFVKPDGKIFHQHLAIM